MKKLIPFVILLMVWFLSCNIPLAKPPSFELDGSSLVLYLNSDLESRTIAPGLDMSVSSYDISGTGPDSDTFSDTGVVGPTYSQFDLTPGAWSVTVNARNSTNDIIGTDTEAFLVVDNETASVDIIVVPLSGTGDLTLNISYPVEVTDPNIDATLIPYGGTSQDLTFTVGATSASYNQTGLGVGYYTLFIRIYDNLDLVYGMVDTVRILSGENTTGDWTLTIDDINAYLAGGVDINLNSDLQNPIGITFSGNVDPLALGTDMTVTTTLDPVVTADSYEWYLNGTLLSGETASSITIGSSLLAGNYRLDVLVEYGSILSAGNVTFTVQ